MVYLKIALKNLLVFCFGFMLCFAEIGGGINPFFVAFVFALAVVDGKILNYIFGVGFARVLFYLSLQSVVVTLNLVAAMIVFWLVTRKKRERTRLILSFFMLILARVAEIIFALSSFGPEGFGLKIIDIVCSLAFLYAYWLFLRAIKIRGTSTKFAIDEILGLALILAPIALVSAKVELLGFPLSSFLVPLLIFFVVEIWGGVEALMVAVIAGLGVGFLNLELSRLAIYSLWAIGASTVKRLVRPIAVVVVIVIDFVIGVFFGVYQGYGLSNFLPIVVAGVLFCAIPQKVIQKLKHRCFSYYKDVCMDEVVEQEERALRERLIRVSGVFLDMNNIYRHMVVGKLDRNQIEETITADIIHQNCKQCLKYKSCFEGRGTIPRCIQELVKKGLNKKSCSLVDTPTLLASVCGKTNQIIFQLNGLIQDYIQCDNEIREEDESKIFVGNQLLGVSELIDEIGKNFCFGERAKPEKEQSLVNSFLFNDIIINECAIFYKKGLFSRAIIVIKNAGYKKSEVIKVINQFFKTKTKILDVRYTKVSGWQVITLVRAPKYTYSVGVGTMAKEGVSGDTFTKLKIDDNKLVLGVSDGKGSGQTAKKISEMTINLIENFYKAGFSTSHIMDNVNRVMSYKSGENFSAVDICAIDLDELRVDFVKKGGTPTIIKKAMHTITIEGDALPIGMLETSETKIESHYLDAGDVIVLSSDGVFDAFGSSDSFAGFINNTPAVNMQEFANTIMTQALRLYMGKPKDDMTVLAIKLLVNK